MHLTLCSVIRAYAWQQEGGLDKGPRAGRTGCWAELCSFFRTTALEACELVQEGGQQGSTAGSAASLPSKIWIQTTEDEVKEVDSEVSPGSLMHRQRSTFCSPGLLTARFISVR